MRPICVVNLVILKPYNLLLTLLPLLLIPTAITALMRLDQFVQTRTKRSFVLFLKLIGKLPVATSTLATHHLLRRRPIEPIPGKGDQLFVLLI